MDEVVTCLFHHRLNMLANQVYPFAHAVVRNSRRHGLTRLLPVATAVLGGRWHWKSRSETSTREE